MMLGVLRVAVHISAILVDTGVDEALMNEQPGDTHHIANSVWFKPLHCLCICMCICFTPVCGCDADFALRFQVFTLGISPTNLKGTLAACRREHLIFTDIHGWRNKHGRAVYARQKYGLVDRIAGEPILKPAANPACFQGSHTSSKPQGLARLLWWWLEILTRSMRSCTRRWFAIGPSLC
jgi:hypothetical protein